MAIKLRKMSLPKVSIIIPYKVDRGYLQQALDSIANQTYKGEIEVILSQSEHRVGYNLNRGIEKATGEFVKYLCDDDYLTPNSIHDSVMGIGGADFLHGNAYNIFPTRTELQKPRIENPSLANMINNNVIHGGTLFYRRDVFERIGLFDESLDCAEEYEFNLRCLANGMRLKYINRSLYNYRRHAMQKSLGKGVDQSVRQHKILMIKQRYK
jgi:glycosyltransferase involved in cell wall biosynthesis